MDCIRVLMCMCEWVSVTHSPFVHKIMRSSYRVHLLRIQRLHIFQPLSLCTQRGSNQTQHGRFYSPLKNVKLSDQWMTKHLVACFWIIRRRSTQLFVALLNPGELFFSFLINLGNLPLTAGAAWDAATSTSYCFNIWLYCRSMSPKLMSQVSEIIRPKHCLSCTWHHFRAWCYLSR